MTHYDYDLFVIGAGSGGVRAARLAAQSYGQRVAIAEEFRIGGTCVIRGCVPKKLLVYASHYSEAIADAAGYGWTIEGARFDWPSLIAAKDAEIARLSGLYDQSGQGLGHDPARAPRWPMPIRCGSPARGAPSRRAQSSSPPARSRTSRRCPAASWRSPPTRRWTCPPCPRASPSSAPATSRWSSPEFSTVWARRSA
jgi:hypothetical protein